MKEFKRKDKEKGIRKPIFKKAVGREKYARHGEFISFLSDCDEITCFFFYLFFNGRKEIVGLF